MPRALLSQCVAQMIRRKDFSIDLKYFNQRFADTSLHPHFDKSASHMWSLFSKKMLNILKIKCYISLNVNETWRPDISWAQVLNNKYFQFN